MTSVSSDAADAIDQTAMDLVNQLVAKACFSVPQKRAMAAAIMRSAGNALAALASHDDAFLTHTRLARRHQVRMGQRGQQR